MKAKEFPLMCKFIHGAFRNNSGTAFDYVQEMECVGTDDSTSVKRVRQQWTEAEKWLQEFFDLVCDTEDQVLRHVFWLGAMADDAYTIYSMRNEDAVRRTLAMPYQILNRYY